MSVWRRPALVGLAGKGVELLTLVPLVTVLPRFFGPADYGDFALALSVVTLSSASVALGGPTLVSRYVAAAPDGDRRALAPSAPQPLTSAADWRWSPHSPRHRLANHKDIGRIPRRCVRAR